MFEESAMRLKVFIPPPGELEIHLWSDTYKVRSLGLVRPLH